MRKNGFTLAEVLITLTIIGIIAAITIPNLMQSYKKHHVEVSLKEAYSILSNATQMSFAENGRCVNNTMTIKQYLSPYLKITKIEKGAQIKEIYCSMDGTCPDIFEIFTNSNKNKISRLTLSNGIQILVLDYENSSCQNLLIVDINGIKKPNTLGKDLFPFSIVSQGMLDNGAVEAFILPFFWCDTAQIRLKTKQELKSQNACYRYGCADGQRGAWCGALIQQNGWKIPDDYPVKKF